MLLTRKKRKIDQRLERVSEELLRAVAVSEREVAATADSDDLYDALRLRIAQRERREGRGPAVDKRSPFAAGLGLTVGMRSSFRWTLTAAAILLCAALATLLWLPRHAEQGHAEQASQQVDQRTNEIAPSQAKEPSTVAASTGEPIPNQSTSQRTEDRVTAGTSANGQLRRASLRRRSRTDSAEVATDFFPLTYVAESGAPESGHVVRVKISRTAMIAFGLPMNAERAGESITADVVIGDDGLARAIRFIQ